MLIYEVGSTREIQDGGTRGQNTIDSIRKSAGFCKFCRPFVSKLT